MAVFCGLLLLLSGCLATKPQKSANTLEFFRADTPKKPVYGVDNPYSNICLLLHDEISETPEKRQEINNSILTELYFSPLFTKVLNGKEATKGLSGKMRDLKNLELIKHVGKSTGIKAFLYAVVDKSKEVVRDKTTEQNMDTWTRFTDMFSVERFKSAREKIVEFSITFNFIDSSTGRSFWSRKGSISAEQSVDTNTFLLIKRTVKELVRQFGSDIGNIKSEGALAISPTKLKTYPLNDIARILRKILPVKAKKQVQKQKIQKQTDSKKHEPAKKTQPSPLTVPKPPVVKTAQVVAAKAAVKKTVKAPKKVPPEKVEVGASASKYRLRLSLPTDNYAESSEDSSEYELLDAVVVPRAGTHRKKKVSKAGIKRRHIAKKIKQIMQKFGEKDFEVADDFVKAIELYMKKWKRGKRHNFSKLMARGKKNNSFNIATSILKKYNLPVELVYIALYESGFDPDAVSKAGAVGLWQMIASTGYRYKLCDNKKCRGRDDRTDPLKSTIAASKYISDLLAEFGGPYVMLAMAAYNLGENGLRRRLRKLKDPIHQRNFWFIYKTKLIPRETRIYVLRIISAIILGGEYEKAHP